VRESGSEEVRKWCSSLQDVAQVTCIHSDGLYIAGRYGSTAEAKTL
jgi:hypothetical protein